LNHIRNEDGREYRVYNATFTEREDNMQQHSYTQHEDSLEARIDQVVGEHAARGENISRRKAFDIIHSEDPGLVKAYHDEARQRARLP
jgi:hypothetical protein